MVLSIKLKNTTIIPPKIILNPFTILKNKLILIEIKNPKLPINKIKWVKKEDNILIPKLKTLYLLDNRESFSFSELTHNLSAKNTGIFLLDIKNKTSMIEKIKELDLYLDKEAKIILISKNSTIEAFCGIPYKIIYKTLGDFNKSLNILSITPHGELQHQYLTPINSLMQLITFTSFQQMLFTLDMQKIIMQISDKLSYETMVTYVLLHIRGLNVIVQSNKKGTYYLIETLDKLNIEKIEIKSLDNLIEKETLFLFSENKEQKNTSEIKAILSFTNNSEKIIKNNLQKNQIFNNELHQLRKNLIIQYSKKETINSLMKIITKKIKSKSALNLKSCNILDNKILDKEIHVSIISSAIKNDSNIFEIKNNLWDSLDNFENTKDNIIWNKPHTFKEIILNIIKTT